jgi:hypothetical protein
MKVLTVRAKAAVAAPARSLIGQFAGQIMRGIHVVLGYRRERGLAGVRSVTDATCRRLMKCASDLV